MLYTHLEKTDTAGKRVEERMWLELSNEWMADYLRKRNEH